MTKKQIKQLETAGKKLENSIWKSQNMIILATMNFADPC